MTYPSEVVKVIDVPLATGNRLEPLTTTSRFWALPQVVDEGDERKVIPGSPSAIALRPVNMTDPRTSRLSRPSRNPVQPSETPLPPTRKVAPAA
jgi:hypothetical protein